MSLCLNIGCDVWKLSGFVNIDINPTVNPDLLLNLNDLQSHFGDNSVDFIYAGHVFEHFDKESSLGIMKQCYSVLKPYRCLLAVCPDWRKSIDKSDEEADRIILAGGDHRMLMSADRMYQMLKASGFTIVQEVHKLTDVPYLLVSNASDPKPDPWQTAFLCIKLVP